MGEIELQNAMYSKKNHIGLSRSLRSKDSQGQILRFQPHFFSHSGNTARLTSKM